MYYSDGRLAYEGLWKDDMFNGYGVYYNDKKEVLPANYSFNYEDFNGLLKIYNLIWLLGVNTIWEKYEGDF